MAEAAKVLLFAGVEMCPLFIITSFLFCNTFILPNLLILEHALQIDFELRNLHGTYKFHVWCLLEESK